MSARGAAASMLRRRSQSSVGHAAPGDRELLRLIGIAGTIADHGNLHPWRIIAIRGEARERVGAALAEASGLEGHAAEKVARKPLRAPLLLAVALSPKPSFKVPEWEQEAVASGVAHALSLLLDEEGWGVMWRTGIQTRSEAVERAHDLAPGERLLGWLYVGSRLQTTEKAPRRTVDAASHFSRL
ncbi:nitroreductase family protein [Salinibacterium sp. ZJ77]|uniref:nitroreductase family protein n=1 Tax=Salinibacterium sp. ZJ77 TaxID=2708337 RepID=UPI001FB8BC0D|nr:nitroreductase family protein [Salinibacterium sp. ZJ77]